jgi:hypothetical protein
MQTENKLNITAGEWKISNCSIKDAYSKIETVFESSMVDTDDHVAGILILNSNKEAVKANAALIADAGTTANLCGLLPSELLKQRDELREALEMLIEWQNTHTIATHSASALFDKARTALASTRP